MTVRIELPADVEQAYLAEAQAKGMSVTDLVREVLIAKRPAPPVTETVFEQGLGLFGSQEDAALLDQVVAIAYEERRRPTKPSVAL
jgi:hypothetical protein